MQTATPSRENDALVLLDPATIKVDAPTYQFRSNGDAHGVTERDRIRADRWNPAVHGDPILVHQRLDGTNFVADGHHRLDLAQRLNASGQGPQKISAFVLREADGYSPEDVRVIAAYKNMANGHATLIESARVFKEARSGRVHTELLPQLQMDKGNLRMSYRLSGLSDQSLNRIEAGEIPARIAVTLADHNVDPARQDMLLDAASAKLKQVNYVLNKLTYEANIPPEMFKQAAKPAPEKPAREVSPLDDSFVGKVLHTRMSAPVHPFVGRG